MRKAHGGQEGMSALLGHWRWIGGEEMKRNALIFLLAVLACAYCGFPADAKTNEEVFQEKLATVKETDAEGFYQLGLWCQKNNLETHAGEMFGRAIAIKPAHENARKKLGHVKYDGKWMSPAELDAGGIVLCNGKWMPRDKAMKAQGYVEFEGQWIKEAILKKIQKLTPPKGVLNKTGADNEDLPWDRARTKETEHFSVKTNLSADALDDICFVLECAFLNLQDQFGISGAPAEKLPVMITRNNAEFQKIYSDLCRNTQDFGAVLVPGGNNANNKSGKDHLIGYYQPPKNILKLLHECVHYVMLLAQRAGSTCMPPAWLMEGWATYYEPSELKGPQLLVNRVDAYRLSEIRNALNKKTAVPLKDLINRRYSDFDEACYCESWSLIYFLMNGQGGRYRQGLQAYMDSWKQLRIMMEVSGQAAADKAGHVAVFEKCTGVPIDQLEREWKEYVLQLK
jgi:hypothetical protein